MAFSTTVAQRGINSQFEGLIQAASGRYGVPVALIKAVISQESSWDPSAVHIDDPNDPQARSFGLMQLVWKYFKAPDGGPILDPELNINTGTSLLASQLQRRPSMELAIAAYNAGTGRSDSDLIDRINRNVNNVGNHVSYVMQFYQWYLANDGGGSSNPPPDGTNGAPDWPNDSDLKLIAGLVVGVLLIFALMRR